MHSLTVLRPCTEMWGSCLVHAADPSLARASANVYIPYCSNGPWGLYDFNGAVVRNTVDLHGPDGESPGQPAVLPSSLSKHLPSAPDRHYVYGGVISLHYGHFIVNSLPRLWTRVTGGNKNSKVLFHGPGTIEDWFARPFLRDIFSALSLQKEDIAVFSEPTIISGLVIPYPSFQEQHFVHRIFGKLGAGIGRALLGPEPLRINNRPIYLSKTRMVSGVGRIINEIVIEETLRSEGIEIAYPETLSLKEQVRLFAERSCIMGFTGSAFHTGFLQPPCGKVICISPTEGPNSNFYLLDHAAGYLVDYQYSSGTKVVGNGSDGFLTSLDVERPDLIASDLLTLCT